MNDEGERIEPAAGDQASSGQCVNCREPATGVVVMNEASDGFPFSIYSHCERCGRQLELAAHQAEEPLPPGMEGPGESYYMSANETNRVESFQRASRIKIIKDSRPSGTP